ncbi:MAG: peptidylprolyl isomerase, partial [Oscillospiraceae bacterium]|nr:peptidylprolyl isomerase [Oscillospiraceae bacterium]
VKYSSAQVNYHYGNDYLNFRNQYGSYASMFGLDTSMGLSSLGDQDCPMLEGGTWRDYFRNTAKSDVQQIRALLDYASENGIELTEEDIAGVDAQFEGIEDAAKNYGYGSADKLYAMNYGSGVNKKIVRQASLNGALAQKATDAKRDSLSWTDAELKDYYDGLNGSRDLFDFDIYIVHADTVENKVTAEDGTETTEKIATDASRAEAKATADAIVAAYKDGLAEAEGTPDYKAVFAAAVDSQTGEAGEQPTQRTSYSGGSLPTAYADWMKDSARKAGDVAAFPDAETDPTTYIAVLYLSRDDNSYNTASVRHILVKAEASEDGTYSDEAKAAAKARAEEILAEFNAGDKTEESFAALAEQYSEDAGSNTNGGLYENIGHGQMVEEFDAFCFGGHKPGDTGIVYGESGSYAGYHVMYYVGEGGLYKDYIAKSELENEAIDAWIGELTDACTVTEGFGFRFVGK